MPDPMDKPQFDALMARAGLALTPEESEGIRAASRHIMGAMASVRTPRDVALEPATIFAPKGATP